MSDPSTVVTDLLTLTANVVAAHIAHNAVPADQLPGLIAAVHGAFGAISAPPAAIAPIDRRKPAVPIGRSVRPDHLVCLEDGMKLQALKRHLRTRYGLTPDAYRARWNLPADYPMVAPDLSERRRQVALKAGLGRTEAAKSAADAQAKPAGPRAAAIETPGVETAAHPRRKLRLALTPPDREGTSAD